MKKVKRILKITLLSFATLITVTLIVLTCVLYDRISSMMSIKHVGGDLYTMNYKQNYHLDKALVKGIKNEEDLLKFICDDMYFGYQIEGNFSKYGCSDFATQTPDGKYIVGRNFDLIGNDTLCLYMHPKKSYASISTVSINALYVGEGNQYATKSLLVRTILVLLLIYV